LFPFSFSSINSTNFELFFKTKFWEELQQCFFRTSELVAQVYDAGEAGFEQPTYAC
jgi:hypothetical protein